MKPSEATELSNQLIRNVAERIKYANTDLDIDTLLGFSHYTKQIQVEGNHTKLHLASIVGQDTHADAYKRFSYSKKSAAIITFDKGDRNSFNQVINYYDRIREENSEMPLVLIGIITGPNQIEEGEGKNLAKNLNMRYYELGLEEEEKTNQILIDLARLCLERAKTESSPIVR